MTAICRCVLAVGLCAILSAPVVAGVPVRPTRTVAVVDDTYMSNRNETGTSTAMHSALGHVPEMQVAQDFLFQWGPPDFDANGDPVAGGQSREYMIPLKFDLDPVNGVTGFPAGDVARATLRMELKIHRHDPEMGWYVQAMQSDWDGSESTYNALEQECFGTFCTANEIQDWIPNNGVDDSVVSVIGPTVYGRTEFLGGAGAYYEAAYNSTDPPGQIGILQDFNTYPITGYPRPNQDAPIGQGGPTCFGFIGPLECNQGEFDPKVDVLGIIKEWDVTAMVKAWADGTENPAFGLVIRNRENALQNDELRGFRHSVFWSTQAGEFSFNLCPACTVVGGDDWPPIAPEIVIEFVPEPASAGLLSLGALLVLRRQRVE